MAVDDWTPQMPAGEGQRSSAPTAPYGSAPGAPAPREPMPGEQYGQHQNAYYQGGQYQGSPYQQGVPHQGGHYPGSQYGGNQYAGGQYQQYAPTQYAAGPYQGSPYAGAQYPSTQYPGTQYPGGQHQQYAPGQYSGWQAAPPAGLAGYGEVAPPGNPGNGLAIAGFVCALIAALLAFVPVFGMLAGPLGLVGLVLAAIALGRSVLGGRRVLAIIGVVLAVIALVGASITTVRFVNDVSATSSQTTSPGSTSGPGVSSPYSGSPSSPVASPSAGDSQFLAVLDRGRIPYTSPSTVIALGHNACSMLQQGSTPQQAAMSTMNTTNYDAYQSGYIVGDSIVAYCPQFRPLIPGR